MTGEKYLSKVILSSDVYAICIQHALSTEKQEIMGLLIGEIDEGTCVSRISACMILHRSDKRPDRVEISPEQLWEASAYAEQLASAMNRPLRVIGWYHSHPHITVWPSYIDIQTQATYQMMDVLFVGLIFSVYQTDAEAKSNQVQVTCFQAQSLIGKNLERRSVPVFIEQSPFQLHNLKGIAKLPKVLVQEEVQSHGTKEKETINPIARLHNDAIKTLALTQIVSKVSIPMCEDLGQRLKATKLRIKELEALKAELLTRKSATENQV